MTPPDCGLDIDRDLNLRSRGKMDFSSAFQKGTGMKAPYSPSTFNVTASSGETHWEPQNMVARQTGSGPSTAHQRIGQYTCSTVDVRKQPRAVSQTAGPKLPGYSATATRSKAVQRAAPGLRPFILAFLPV